MKSTIFLTLSLMLSIAAVAQEKYLTKNGHAWFKSETPVETIEAHNRQVTAIMTSEGKLAFKILMKSFEFPKALMQEHFNENYVESDKYPLSTFEGQIDDMSKVNLAKDGTYQVTVTGNLSCHGQTQKVTTPATLMVKDGKIQGLTTFKMPLAAYQIEIPGAVADKIEKEITVNIDVLMEPFTR